MAIRVNIFKPGCDRCADRVVKTVTDAGEIANRSIVVALRRAARWQKVSPHGLHVSGQPAGVQAEPKNLKDRVRSYYVTVIG